MTRGNFLLITDTANWMSIVSGLALDPLNRVWRELEDRRDHRRR